MTNNISKTTSQVLLGFLMLAFAVAACNNKKDEKKESTVVDTTVVTPLPPIDTTGMDTATTRPVKTPD